MNSERKKSSGIIDWQKKLLPFMIGMIAILTVFFFIASFVQLYYLHSRIEKCPDINLNSLLINLENKGLPQERNLFDYTKWKTLAILEEHALKRRYHQANVLLMSRIWRKYLGFVTGMILAMVGAAFILGKLRSSESRLEAESKIWKITFITASPGLILCVLGVALMITTIVTYYKIEVTDVPVYLGNYTISARPEDSPQTKPSKPDINEIIKKLKKAKEKN